MLFVMINLRLNMNGPTGAGRRMMPRKRGFPSFGVVRVARLARSRNTARQPRPSARAGTFPIAKPGVAVRELAENGRDQEAILNFCAL